MQKGQPLPTGCGFSGEWQTNHEVGGWVKLVQTGATVNGEFFNGATNGSINGKLGIAGRDGNASYRLYGSYQEPSSSGTFRFDLVDFNSTQFQGCWQNSDGKTDDWCGWRKDGQQADDCLPATPTCPSIGE